ncbi:MAG: hypothetical protein J3K34DRAFT_415668 [Monoraphidium minutum]|nr:MAG: hypothetical protein J3K34DRAFT_415668 [Monoraphidium minutum]
MSRALDHQTSTCTHSNQRVSAANAHGGEVLQGSLPRPLLPAARRSCPGQQARAPRRGGRAAARATAAKRGPSAAHLDSKQSARSGVQLWRARSERPWVPCLCGVAPRAWAGRPQVGPTGQGSRTGAAPWKLQRRPCGREVGRVEVRVLEGQRGRKGFGRWPPRPAGPVRGDPCAARRRAGARLGRPWRVRPASGALAARPAACRARRGSRGPRGLEGRRGVRVFLQAGGGFRLRGAGKGERARVEGRVCGKGRARLWRTHCETRRHQSCPRLVRVRRSATAEWERGPSGEGGGEGTGKRAASARGEQGACQSL